MIQNNIEDKMNSRFKMSNPVEKYSDTNIPMALVNSLMVLLHILSVFSYETITND